jgi:penicillin-binding protein 1B
LASYYGPDLEERRPLKLAEISNDLITAVLAAEDAGFTSHGGVSVGGILRALWVNLRGGEVRQGGSTLTQQLVKNLYLTHDRTLARKSRELVLALLLELRYTKEEILEAYLNEIYLGGSGGVSLLGVQSASRAYFGKDASQLDLAEAATLAGMIRSPAHHSPIAHPARAIKRRNWVLDRLTELDWVEKERIAKARAQPLWVAPEPVVRRRAPYFADAAAQEAARRFGVEAGKLADAGYVLFSTLDWDSQQAAQQAVEWGVERVESGYQKGYKGEGPLQAALVSVDPRSGEILAYLGGREYGESQFDRASQALRQVGSTFKPIVYAAAFEHHTASPASFLDDAPLAVALPGQPAVWTPKNDDGQFHGYVSVRSALEKSYNLATARLAMAVGMDRVVALARDLGISSKMEPFPSIALGAVEVTPLELSTVYSAFATGGLRPTMHGLSGMIDRYGKPLQSEPLPEPVRVVTPQTAYLVTSLLQGVLVRGTAAGSVGPANGTLAGKTGTTNKQRDSWFAGYSTERVTVVWVGYDDNSKTRLSGSRAALPIWTRFIAKAPRGSYQTFKAPVGVTSAVIDPSTGLLATEFCPVAFSEVFRVGESPLESCDRHTSWIGESFASVMGAQLMDDELVDEYGETLDADRRKAHPFRNWLRRVFGEAEDPKPKPPANLVGPPP